MLTVVSEPPPLEVLLMMKYYLSVITHQDVATERKIVVEVS